MTLLFLEGFETYNGIANNQTAIVNALGKKWAAVSGATIDFNSGGRKNLAGKYLSLSPGTGGNRGVIGKHLSFDGITSVITGVAIKFSTTPGAIDGTATNPLLKIYDSANSPGNFLYPTTLGDPEAWQIGNQTFTMTGFTYGAWHYLEAKISFSSGTTWNATVKLNGTQMFNSTTNLNIANIRSIHYGNVADSTASLYLDDIYISDNTGSVNNDFMTNGYRCMIEAVTPNTDANYTQWVPKPPSANHYTSIDIDDQTSTVVYTDIADNKDSYACSDLTYLNSTIHGICITTLGKNTLLDSGAILRQFTRIGGTDYTAGDYTSPNLNAINFIGHNTGVDVNPATNNPWTIAEINALEVGIQYVAGGGGGGPEPLSVIAQANGSDIVITFSDDAYVTTNDPDADVEFNIDGGQFNTGWMVSGQNTTTITLTRSGTPIYDISTINFNFGEFYATSDDSPIDMNPVYGAVTNNSTLSVPNDVIYFGGDVDPVPANWYVYPNAAAYGLGNNEVVVTGDVGSCTSIYASSLSPALNGRITLGSSFTGMGWYSVGGNMIIDVVGMDAPNVDRLYINNNQITNIDMFPASMDRIYCDNNLLTALPTLPTDLLRLYCNNNSLTSLPSLPSTLTDLDCSYNPLTSLPTLSTTSLTFIQGRNCSLTSIPTLPTSMVSLQLHNNSLTSLPSLPSSVQTVYVYNNLLTSLPSASSGLTYIQFFDNPTLDQSDIDTFFASCVSNCSNLNIIRCMNTAAPSSFTDINTLQGSPNNALIKHDYQIYTGGSITPNFSNWTALWSNPTDYTGELHASGNNVITDNCMYSLVVNETLDGTFNFPYASGLLPGTLTISAGLSQANVDAILAKYDQLTNLSGYTITLTGNTAPSGAGLASKSSIEGKFGVVYVDP